MSLLSKTAPLVKRQAIDPIAWLCEPIRCLGGHRGFVSAQQFLSHVEGLARVLPHKRHAIILCDNRYLFLVSLCAVVLREQTNLLPPNRKPITQTNLAARYPETYLIHDGSLDQQEIDSKIFAVNLDTLRLDQNENEAALDNTYCVPEIEISLLALISFTSGSTGEPKANIKTWQTLVTSSEINGRYMLPDFNQTYYHLATVPGQHMWGLETSVLLPMFAKVCLSDSRPFYPHEIQLQLRALPTPRALVATPLHLRALLTLKDKLPPLANVLCATAPLTRSLASDIEQRFDTELREVYGCSEVGSMAVRRTVNTDLWQSFDGLEFKQDTQGTTSVSATHLPLTIALEDSITMLPDGQFRLGARCGDQIKVAGKRGSLQEVNRVLMEYPFISDGVVFFPPQERVVPRLAALVVLSEQGYLAELKKHFRNRIDTAFIPRPILEVDSLPRETNGKLPKDKLLAFYQSLKR